MEPVTLRSVLTAQRKESQFSILERNPGQPSEPQSDVKPFFKKPKTNK